MQQYASRSLATHLQRWPAGIDLFTKERTHLLLVLRGLLVSHHLSRAEAMTMQAPASIQVDDDILLEGHIIVLRAVRQARVVHALTHTDLAVEHGADTENKLVQIGAAYVALDVQGACL